MTTEELRDAITRGLASVREEVAAEGPAIIERSFERLHRLGFEGPAAPILHALSQAGAWIDHAEDCPWPRLAERAELEWRPLSKPGSGAIARCPDCRAWIEIGPQGQPPPTVSDSRRDQRATRRRRHALALTRIRARNAKPTDIELADEIGISERTLYDWRKVGDIPEALNARRPNRKLPDRAREISG